MPAVGTVNPGEELLAAAADDVDTAIDAGKLALTNNSTQGAGRHRANLALLTGWEYVQNSV